jgi:hypothetical protein
MRADQGHLAVKAKASGSVPDTPLTKGCQTWRWIGAIKLVDSLLLLAFVLLYVATRAREYRTRHHALVTREFTSALQWIFIDSTDFHR